MFVLTPPSSTRPRDCAPESWRFCFYSFRLRIGAHTCASRNGPFMCATVEIVVMFTFCVLFNSHGEPLAWTLG